MASKKKFDSQKILLGIALVVVGALLVFGRPEKTIQQVFTRSFEEEPVRVEGFNLDSQKEGSPPQRVVIPDLTIDLEVKEADVISGYWEVFPDTAAWGTGSGLPGESGNQVVFAHAREGLFLPLRSVKLGQRVYILSEDTWYEYEVAEIKEVFPNEVEVIAPTEDETLTLYTCSGFADSKRLIVVAKRSDL